MVGRLALDQEVGVRIPAPQPHPAYVPALRLTSSATAWICRASSLPRKEGMSPMPCVTTLTTSAGDGFVVSRLGPNVPLAPAAASV